LGDTSTCIDLIRANVHRYGQALSNEDKRIITLEIMDEIHQSAGRFLKHVDERGWMEIAPAEAQKKVAHAIQYQQRATSSSTCSSTRVMKSLQMKCDTSSSNTSSMSSSSDSIHQHPPPSPYSTHAATATYHEAWNLDSEPLSLVDVLCRSPDHQHHHPVRNHPCSSHQTTNSDIHDTRP
jgi:hypothetical protein